MSDLFELRRSLWLSPKSRLWLPRFNNQFSPGGSTCGCCETVGDPCAIFSDNYDRADDSSPGANWSEENGQVAISSNKLAYISGSDVACISTTTHTSHQVTITVDVRQTGFVLISGTEFRVILSYVDASNYVYAALKIGTSQYLRIVERVGGVDTVLDTVATTTTINTTYTLTACMGPTYIYVSMGGAEVNAFVVGTTGEFGVGFGAADIFSTFDNFVARAVEDGCEECQRPICTLCDANGTPESFELTIAGIVDGDPVFDPTKTCTDCHLYNGTWTLTRDGECRWRYDTTDHFCGTSGLFGWILDFIPDGSGIPGNGTMDLQGTENLAPAFSTGTLAGLDCLNLVDFPLPFEPGGSFCDQTGATCTITSL